MKSTLKRQRGLTLIEILVVLVIIGVIAMLVVPNVMGRGEQARIDATKISLKQVAGILDSYKLDNMQYPSMEEGGLQALISRSESARSWPEGGYFPRGEMPKDGWDNEFQYRIPATQENRPFDLYSFGADGKEGGEESAADIYY